MEPTSDSEVERPNASEFSLIVASKRILKLLEFADRSLSLLLVLIFKLTNPDCIGQAAYEGQERYDPPDQG